MMKVDRFYSLALLALLGVAAAQAKTPVPAFSGDRVSVAGVADSYAPVRAEIERIQKASPQQYYVVVVQSSGQGAYATREYVDELYQVWTQQARQRGQALDPNRSVVIVLALENRQLALHAGTLLQTKYGLQGQAIDRLLVQPHFIPHARAGDFVTGLISLLNETEKFVAAKDEAERRQQQAAAARVAEIERNAESTLAAANKLRGEVLTELSARRDSGLDVQLQQERTDRASQALLPLTAKVTTQPQIVLEEGRQAQASLQQVLDELRGLAALQSKTVVLLDDAEAEATRIEQLLETDRKSDLSIAAVQSQLDRAWSLLEDGREKLRSQPAEASALAEQAKDLLAQAEQDRGQLPRLAKDFARQQTTVQELYDQVGGELSAAVDRGVAVDDPQSQFQQVEEQLASVSLDDTGYAAALKSLESLESSLLAQRQQIASLENRHTFTTQTLPLGGGALVAALLAATAGGLWFRRGRLERQARDRLTAYKQQVVQLLERLDALKQQHQYLPFTDKDFTEPMSGTTLAAYNEVEALHDQLRERWLAMMEVRQRAEKLVESQSRFGTGQYSELLRLLADTSQAAEVDALYQQCAEHLDRLGQAHERAEAALQAADQNAGQLQQQVQTLAEARLTAGPYEAALQVAGTSVEQARAALRADPLGASSVLEQVQAALKVLGQRIERALALLKRAGALEAGLNEIAQKAADHRAAGLRLAEPEADPDPWLAKGRIEQTAAMASLNAADADAAELHLAAGHEHTERARHGIERQVAAREFCRQDIPARRQEMQRLEQLLGRAAQQQQELQRGFTADTWQDVAEHAAQAQATLGSLETLLNEAQRDAADSAQFFVRAAERLGAIHEQQQHVAARLAALSTRLTELVALRENCLARRKELIQQAGQMRSWIAEHDAAVRAEARDLLALAERAIESSPESLQAVPTNWVHASGLLEQAQQNLAAARQQAQADAQAHQQLVGRLDGARRLADQIEQLLRGHTADRPRANQRFQAAQQDLARLRQAASIPRGDWIVLAAQLQQIVEDFENARQWAQEDIRLQQQAAAAIDEAEKHYQRARTYLSLGASANLSAAESQLDRARNHLHAQDYEQAVTLADGAERAARTAYDEAVQETRRRQAKLERAQQRRTFDGPLLPPVFGGGQGTLGLPNLPFPTSGGFSFPSTPASPSPSPSPPPSTSSSSGWSSGSSQSSW